MRLPIVGELNLATKVIGLFGLAVTAVALLALILPFARMQSLVDTGQLETARALHDAWDMLPPTPDDPRIAIGDASITRFSIAELQEGAREDWRLAQILRRAEKNNPARADHELQKPPDPDTGESAFSEAIPDITKDEVFLNDWEGWEKRYTYARIDRDPDGSPIAVTVLERTSEQAASEAAINSLFLLSAGVLVLAVAMTTFWIITARLILRPVKSLKIWAESVGDGNIDERCDLQTGDEFQQLAETFNASLDQLEERERTLRSINIAMDVRLNELAEVNEALDKAARLKSEFLAGVSHELRTPLNSIIGFTELLLDIARREAKLDDTDEAISKRTRYLENIVEGSRGLLSLIEGLLEMARIEAGKTEINPELLNPIDACRGMVGLAEPLAARNGVTLEIDARPEVPLIETDSRKFQQIVFNLVTNAIKFTGPKGSDGKPGRVLVRIERVPGESGTPTVRVCVIDNGPGIAPADQAVIFDRFNQLESGHERRHGGVGLGLAISRDLAALLQADLQLFSEPGQGAMFSVIFPLRLEADKVDESRLEARFRGTLNRQIN